MYIRKYIEATKLPEGANLGYFFYFSYKTINWLDNLVFDQLTIPRFPLNTKQRDEYIIVSLTSYPARIAFVHQAIKSLMMQTCKPDKIFLWLAEEQFPNKELPSKLLELCSYGLDIMWMNDLYGHKKYYYPVLNQKTNEVVITFDDDILYSPVTIERIMKKHKLYPNCLVCERGQTFEDKDIQNPGRWRVNSELGVNLPTFSMNPSPGGGCLIPYHGFYKDAVDEQKIRSLAYKNDDLWYMFMCAENGTQMIKTRKNHRTFTVIKGSQIEQMANANVKGDVNIAVMDSLKQSYPNAWRRILKDIL